MPLIVAERMTAHIEGEIVVFLIGMRINRLWKVHKWLPVARAMPRMLAELAAAPEHGFAVGSGGGAGVGAIRIGRRQDARGPRRSRRSAGATLERRA